MVQGGFKEIRRGQFCGPKDNVPITSHGSTYGLIWIGGIEVEAC